MDVRSEVFVYAVVAEPMQRAWDAWLHRNLYAAERLPAPARAALPFPLVRHQGYFQATFDVYADEDWEAYWDHPAFDAEYAVYRVILVDAQGWDLCFAAEAQGGGTFGPPATGQASHSDLFPFLGGSGDRTGDADATPDYSEGDILVLHRDM